MIEYGTPPGHRSNPVNLPGTDIILCGCDECVEVRQRWSDRQPPLSEELHPADAED